MALRARGDAEAAFAELRRARMREPNSFEVQFYYGIACAERGRIADAATAFDAAHRLRPQDTAALNNLGAALLLLGERPRAARAFEMVLAAEPRQHDATINLARILLESGRAEEAIRLYRAALANRPDDPSVMLALAAALDSQRDSTAALDLVRRVLARTDDLRVLGFFAHLQLRCCDWADWDRTIAALPAAIAAAEKAGTLDQVPASLFLHLPVSLQQRSRLAGAHARRLVAEAAATGWQRPKRATRAPGDRLRIGYLSGRFNSDAIGQLMVDVFPAHDRARFAVDVFSYGRDDGSTYRRRIAGEADRFVDVAALSHLEVAQRIAAAEIDILIDIDAMVQGGRPQIAALRPAPLQVRYIDFVGAACAPFYDYIVADHVALPFSQQPHYVEKIAHMPPSYFVNASSQTASPDVPTREACGLDGFGFVFCCFNTNTKIEPEVFALWMRVLREVPDSALWLLGESPDGAANLRRTAQAAGVDPQRLVFAPFAERSQHLARLGHADLVLDTLIYNAHTTASDALWAGVPVLTWPGEAYAARVCASLLTAAGLTDLIVASADEYVATAVALAHDRQRYRALRERVAGCRAPGGLFDSANWTRRFEAVLLEIWRLHTSGEAPRNLSV